MIEFNDWIIKPQHVTAVSTVQQIESNIYRLQVLLTNGSILEERGKKERLENLRQELIDVVFKAVEITWPSRLIGG